MAFVDIDELEELKQWIPLEIERLVSTLAINFKEAAEKTNSLSNIYSTIIVESAKQVDTNIDLTKEFIVKCEILEENLQVVEKLGKQITYMRKYCEDLEKKVNKIF